ncbi:MAG: extracellular solute-binding protein [Cyanobacteria bacterium P01_H01_bin.15]
MIKRRRVLQGLCSLSVLPLLAGCDRAQAFSLLLLKGSIPASVLEAFQKGEQGTDFSWTAQPQLADIFARLQVWQGDEVANQSQFRIPTLAELRQGNKPGPQANLATLGDYWLTSAITKELLDPFEPNELPKFERLPAPWRAIVKRDSQGLLAKNGKIWGAPYRWGSLLIVYREDKLKKFDWIPTDWSDLWRPELAQRFSLPADYRLVLAIGLKKLGASPNATQLPTDLLPTLQELQNRVMFYSSNTYLQPLVLGDSWMGVGWSEDILPLIARNPKLKAIAPESGTILWSDVWVKPKGMKNSPISTAWIEHCWQPKVAANIAARTAAGSPVLLDQPTEEFPPKLQQNPLFLLSASIRDRSEFLEPLSPEIEQKYQELWQALRGSS